jgi:outer membrane receptor protein involved in Fe transport
MRSCPCAARRFAVVAVVVLLHVLPALADESAVTTTNSITGIVLDTGDATPLPGAEVRLVELGRVVFTDADGRFEFRRVPRGTFTLGVHLAGFSSHHGAVSIPLADPLTIELSATRFEDEITVSASPFAVNRLEVAQQVDIVSGQDVKRESTASLGQALSTTPGVANIPTGEGLGTPVIRGLSENRIRVLNDGIPLNHQQFSWRHSPNVEASLATGVEVVRGPASVLYGPDAMGGVINVLQSPLLVSHGEDPIVRGEVAAGWGSNADEFTGRAEAEGAVGGFGWNVGLVRRDSGNITTPDAELDNTDFDQTNGNVSVGLTGAWGTARLRYNHWELDTGFYRPQDFRLELQDDLVAADLFVPTTVGDIEVTAGHQTNLRQAYPAPLGGIAAVDLDLTTRTLRAGLHHRPLGAFRGRIAVESLRLENTESGPANLLPDYTSDGLAVMLFEEGRFLPSHDGDHDRLIVSFGLRWDESDLEVPTDESRDLPDGYSSDYSAVTGSVGVVYRLTSVVAVAGNLGYGWRPPNAFELFAKGVHNGVAAVQIGNPDLVEESNINAEVSVRFETDRIRAYLTGYRNDFDDFIYIADSGEVQDGLPVFVYRQADAVIEGIEASLEAAVLDWLHLGVTSTWIDTENRSIGTALPQQPANRWQLHAEAGQRQMGALRNVFVGADVHLVDSQEVSGPDEPFGVATDSYTLVDLRAGFELPAAGVTWGLDLTVRNLFDESYTDFLYSYKAFALNPGRDVRLVGRLRF